MSYRTLEEKFLADFEAMETVNQKLMLRVTELENQLVERRGNIVLDNMVRVEGRKEVFDNILGWKRMYPPKTTLYSFDAWCEKWLSECADLPKGVSHQEIVDYFGKEFEAEYERKADEDAEEGQ